MKPALGIFGPEVVCRRVWVVLVGVTVRWIWRDGIEDFEECKGAA